MVLVEGTNLLMIVMILIMHKKCKNHLPGVHKGDSTAFV